ncbi:MAG: SRPBCC family protein, partial [Rhodobacterales bacterium CG_4_9_14_3_um_filter_71_31]
IDGVEHRRLGLKGGGEIVERSLGGDAHSYGYAIVSGPLPVADYVSTLTVAPAGSGSVVVWTSAFTPAAEGAEAVIAGVYEAGLAALAARF